MRVITLNYDPLNCTCWSVPVDGYCEYCNLVCEVALADYEAGIGDWLELGQERK